MFKIGNIFVVMSLMVAALALNGCAGALLAGGAAAGAGGVMYAQGDLEKDYPDTTLDALYQATKKGLADLEFGVKSDRKDALQFKVVAEMADGTDVSVDGEHEEGVNELDIRVGVFGDKEKSMMILEAIEAHL